MYTYYSVTSFRIQVYSDNICDDARQFASWDSELFNGVNVDVRIRRRQSRTRKLMKFSAATSRDLLSELGRRRGLAWPDWRQYHFYSRPSTDTEAGLSLSVRRRLRRAGTAETWSWPAGGRGVCRR